MKRLFPLLPCLLMCAAACTSGSKGGGGTDPATASGSPDVSAPKPGYLARVACSIPDAHKLLLRTWEGYRADRSGQVQFLPIPKNFVDGGINHSGPWDYLERVPLLFYGPGYIKTGTYSRDATLADIAPTFARLLHFGAFHAPDGQALTEALVPGYATKSPPKLIVTVVWDAGGRDVIDWWGKEHPYLDSLIKKSAWFKNAEIGASPSATAPGHASIGTGALPRHNGIVGNEIRQGNTVIGPWQLGPKSLLEPTVGDLYDKAMGNRPVVGVVGTVPWYLGMIGHGSQMAGGDRDIAALRPGFGSEGAEGYDWKLPPVDAPYYTFPAYVNKLTPLQSWFHFSDALDGKVDGKWLGNDITSEALKKGFDTPARIPYQTNIIEKVLTREHFGQDNVPDLFYTNYKLIDEIGHIFYYQSPEEQETIKVQDHYLKVLVDYLNRTVGRGNYVLALTADHGHTPKPWVSHSFRIRGVNLNDLVRQAFDGDHDGRDLIINGKPSYFFLNKDELHQNGFTMQEVARFLLKLTKEQTYFDKPDPFGPPDPPSPAHRNDPIIQAAFPSSMLFHLPCLPEAHGAPRNPSP